MGQRGCLQCQRTLLLLHPRGLRTTAARRCHSQLKQGSLVSIPKQPRWTCPQNSVGWGWREEEKSIQAGGGS